MNIDSARCTVVDEAVPMICLVGLVLGGWC